MNCTVAATFATARYGLTACIPGARPLPSSARRTGRPAGTTRALVVAAMRRLRVVFVLECCRDLDGRFRFVAISPCADRIAARPHTCRWCKVRSEERRVGKEWKARWWQVA